MKKSLNFLVIGGLMHTLKTNDDLGYAAVLKTDNPNNVPYIGTLYNTGKIQWKMGMIF